MKLYANQLFLIINVTQTRIPDHVGNDKSELDAFAERRVLVDDPRLRYQVTAVPSW